MNDRAICGKLAIVLTRRGIFNKRRARENGLAAIVIAWLDKIAIALFSASLINRANNRALPAGIDSA